MHIVDVLEPPTAAQRGELVAFVEGITASTGARPLSDHLWLDLQSGSGQGLIAVRAADSTGTVAYAQISAANDSSSLEIVLRPGSGDAGTVGDDVADTAVDAFRVAGGGHLNWWVDDPTAEDASHADRLGLAPVRAIHEMRRPLPHEQHATVATRDFVVGRDEDPWIEVNNRAFADHDEQGGWTRSTLDLRMAEPWFDPAGFRIHEIDGELAAFCWTKLHHESDPMIGEIYVIAVDPAHHGRGLGKQLTLAGLDSIADRGVSIASLYVDADNDAAAGLYDGLGFTIHRTRQAYAGVIRTPSDEERHGPH